ncbi:MAG: hypothetical protein WC208_14130 [Gallionella sp.]|jgi:hypothetical protein
MSKIVDKMWWITKSGTTVGIVVVQPEFGARKAYLGLGEGIDAEADAKLIAEWGVPVYAQHLEPILASLKGLT